MKVLCLGGAGRICREAVLDLVQFSSFSRITVADVDQRAGDEVVRQLDDSRVDYVPIDISDEKHAVDIMSGYDLVLDGTPISVNDASTRCIAHAGVHGVNLNGFGAEWAYDSLFKQRGRIMIPGFGMTPGVTNMMAMHAASKMDSVETVRCSHGAFRPIAFSKAIAETTRIEYDPDYPARVVFEDGELISTPPFARPRQITLPQPYGTHIQYIIPHPEPVTLSKSLADKGIRLVEARGTWPPRNMQLLRALYDWGILRNDTVEVNGCHIGVLDAVFAHCLQSEEGRNTDLYGYALHVEVLGIKKQSQTTCVLTHTHPPSDGSVADWAGLRAYTRNVAIPFSIAGQLVAAGQCRGEGVVTPEMAFDPVCVFEELRKRNIAIHEHWTRERSPSSKSWTGSRLNHAIDPH